MIKFIFTVLFVTLGAISLIAQDKNPQVFIIGEQEELHAQLSNDYARSLLEANDGNMEAAFDAWVDFISSMEDAAKKQGLDLNGVKIWLQVFFEPDGSIGNLAYHLRPQSKNIDAVKINSFLQQFAKEGTMKMTADFKFNHYSTAAFPVHFQSNGG